MDLLLSEKFPATPLRSRACRGRVPVDIIYLDLTCCLVHQAGRAVAPLVCTVQGRSHVSKIEGVHLFFQTPQTSNYSGQRRRGERGMGGLSPLLTRESGGVASSPSGVCGGAPAANDFGAFHVQFYAISRTFYDCI